MMKDPICDLENGESTYARVNTVISFSIFTSLENQSWSIVGNALKRYKLSDARKKHTHWMILIEKISCWGQQMPGIRQSLDDLDNEHLTMMKRTINSKGTVIEWSG